VGDAIAAAESRPLERGGHVERGGRQVAPGPLHARSSGGRQDIHEGQAVVRRRRAFGEQGDE
jgi:hypothetical protein